MTYIKPRTVVMAVALMANVALTLSSSMALAQAPHRQTREAPQHYTQQTEAAPDATTIAAMSTDRRAVSMNAGPDFSSYCGFSGVNAC